MVEQRYSATLSNDFGHARLSLLGCSKLGHGLRRLWLLAEAATFALVATIHTTKDANNSNSQGNANDKGIKVPDVFIIKAPVGTTIVFRKFRTCRRVASEHVALVVMWPATSSSCVDWDPAVVPM